MSTSNIRQHNKENKKFRPNEFNGDVVSSVNIEQLKDDLNKMSRTDVAKKYGVHFGTISKWKKKFGLDIKKNFVMPQEFEEDAKLLTIAQLTQKYKMSEKAIIRRINKLDIEYGDRRAEKFKQRVNEIVGEEYTVVGEYIDYSTQVLIKHNKCGCEWNIIPGNFFYHNSRCPICSGYNSKGDQAIRKYLDEKKYTYIEQYTYSDCYWKDQAHPLRFDFAIIVNSDVRYLIEFDGMQHFKPIKLFGGEKYFEEIKIRDNIKDEYCKERGIQLIRIPYTQVNKIFDILDRKISL